MIKIFFNKTDFLQKGSCSFCYLTVNIGMCYYLTNRELLCSNCAINVGCYIYSGIQHRYPYKSQHYEQLIEFFSLTCCVHTDVKAELIEPAQQLSFCFRCKIGDFIDDFKSKYDSLTKFFTSKFSQLKRRMCPETRKALLCQSSLKFQSLLGACRFLYELENGISCKIDCLSLAKYIAVETFDCFSVYKESLLMLTEDTRDELISRLKLLIKDTESRYLNKKSLKLRQFSEMPLQDLIFIWRDIKAHKEQPLRCVVCYSLLTLGRKAGVLLSCRHTICFQCHMSEHVVECPLDRETTFGKCAYIAPDLGKLIPTCHSAHPLLPTLNIYSLKCGHISCKVCCGLASCLQCFQPLDLAKQSLKSIEILKLTSLICEIHEQPATKLNFRCLELCCEYCQHSKGLHLSFPRDFSTVLSLFCKIFMDGLRHKIVRKDKSLDFLKACEYFNVISLMEKFKVVRKMFLYMNPQKWPTSEYIKVERFRLCYPVKLQSCKHWIIQQDEIIEFGLVLKKNCFLAGFIIAGQYRSEAESCELEDCGFFVRFIKIFKGSKTVFTSEAVGRFEAKVNDVYLKTPVFLQADKQYLTEISVSAGHYYHGVPYTAIKSDLISVIKTTNRLKYEEEKSFMGRSLSNPIFSRTESYRPSKNYHLGGCLLGFILFSP